MPLQTVNSGMESEVAEFIAQHRELKDERERQRIVRNGYQPERTIQTGIGEVAVKQPRVRDRQGTIKYSSSLLPPSLRRTKSIEELLPWLYLKGLSTGDFSTALTALLGQDAPGLSAATISRLEEVWKEEYQQWARRDLRGKEIVYLWADGVHFGVRLEDANQCILVIIGATADGKKQLLAMTDGYRESIQCYQLLKGGMAKVFSKEFMSSLVRVGEFAHWHLLTVSEHNYAEQENRDCKDAPDHSSSPRRNTGPTKSMTCVWSIVPAGRKRN
jgi:transposase-like protein